MVARVHGHTEATGGSFKVLHEPRTLGGAEVLGLPPLGLQDDDVVVGQGRCAVPARVGVGGLDDGEQVLADTVAGVT